MLRPTHRNPFLIRPPDDFVKNHLGLKNMSHNLATKYADMEVVTDSDLESMGSRLWEALDIQTDFDSACSEAGAAILPVMIESAAAEVQALPWETLVHPEHGFLGKHSGFTLTRRISVDSSVQARLEKGPLRVLLFTSSPEDVNPETGRLKVEGEQEKMQEALLPWIAKGLVELEMPDDGRFSTLQDLLKDFRPHVLFLSGHGQFHNIPHANEAYGVFLFENEAGDKEAIKDDRIAEVLSDTSVQAVILSACESGQAASNALSSGLMGSISTKGIPHVIGMRESIVDEAGIQFARILCDALAQGERMGVALQAARIAIQAPMKDISADQRSLGQWCLPMMISPNPDMPLIDWNFQPKELEDAPGVRSVMGDVVLPEHFVGRRAEMRRLKNRLFKGEFHKLLVTGPGGQGKTSLAGKLASDLQRRGWQVFAWSAKQQMSWHDFELGMKQMLDGPRGQRYEDVSFGTEYEYERASLMLDLLMEQFRERVVMFLDNIQSIQDPDKHVLTDSVIAAWVKAALETQNLILFVTSRWKIPNWEGEHLMLAQANYGDFLQMAQRLGFPATILERRRWLRRVHIVLGGNSRGLEFYATAVRNMQNSNEEDALLETLAKTKADLQADMAIAEIYQRLPSAAQNLLRRLPVYHEPVPLDGFVRLGPDLHAPEELLECLLVVSLLESSHVHHWNVIQYQCNPLVKDWLDEHRLSDRSPDWLNIAADYHLNLFFHEQRTLFRAIDAHHALRRAQRHLEADRLTLDYVIGPMTLAGSYMLLLKEWLPPIYNSQDVQARVKALAHTGILLKNIGKYEAALEYLKAALANQRQAKDPLIESVLLNNIGITYQAMGDPGKALKSLEQALAIQQQIKDKRGEARTLSNLAQIYQGWGDYKTALKNLATALEIQKQTGDPNQGTTLNNISQISKAQGDYDTTLKYLKQALVIQQQIGDKAGEGNTLNNISGIYQRRNQYETALEYLKQALVIQQQIGDKAGEGISLNNISGSYRRKGKYDTALKYLKQALVIQQQIGDKAGEAMTLSNIGTTYQMQGEFEKTLTYLEQALTIRKKLGDKAGEAQLLNNIGTVHQMQGDYEMALKNFEQALIIIQEIGGKTGKGTTLNNIGTIRQIEGDHETALKNFEQALALTREIGDQIGESTTLNNIGTVHEAQRNYQAALLAHNQALEIRRQISDRAGEEQSLNNLSKIYRAQGDLKTALAYLERAQIIQKEIKDRPGLCTTLLNLGHIHRQNGNREKATDAWLNAYLLAKEMKLRPILQELAKLAPTVGLQEGREDWEALAQKRK